MSDHERRLRILDIGFQVGTGRANLETEQAAMETVGADSLASFPSALKSSPDSAILAVWRLCCGSQSVMGLK